MSLVNHTIQVGKKYAVYIPKKVVDKLKIKEGDILLLSVEEDKIILKHVKKPSSKVKYWSKVSPDEVEEIGEEISEQILD